VMAQELLRSEAAVPAGVAPVGPSPVEPAPVEPVAAQAPQPPAVPAQRTESHFADAAAPTQHPRAGGGQDLSIKDRARHPLAPTRAFFTLCLRMISVILSDRGYAAFLLGLPLALAVLSRAVPGDKGLSPDPLGFSLEAQRLLVVFVIGAAFM